MTRWQEKGVGAPERVENSEGGGRWWREIEYLGFGQYLKGKDRKKEKNENEGSVGEV